MPKLYVTADGEWGNAEHLRIIDMTADEISALDEMSENEASETVQNMPGAIGVDALFEALSRDKVAHPPLEQWEVELLTMPEHDIPMDEEARLRGEK